VVKKRKAFSGGGMNPADDCGKSRKLRKGKKLKRQDNIPRSVEDLEQTTPIIDIDSALRHGAEIIG